MSGVTINYKGGALASMDATGTKTLLTSGKYCEGNIEIAYEQPKLVPYALRPDAELIQSYEYDKYIVADAGLDFPAYTTTATTIKATSNLSPTISVDFSNYRYYVVEKFLTIPEYSVNTKAKGRVEYQWCCYNYEIARLPANEIATIIDPTKKVTAVSTLISASSLYRMLYWSSGTAIALYATNGYGVYQTPTAPSVSGSTLTIKAPVLATRGSTTYFTSTYMNAVTDVRYQYAIDVYRAPVNGFGETGWEQEQILLHIVDCINKTNHKLT